MRGKISLDEGKKLIDILMDITSLMRIIKIGLNMIVYAIAVKNNISYYDASYIYAALSSREALVSEDEKLIEMAIKYGIKSYAIEEI